MLSRPLLARRFRPSALSPSRSIRTLASSTLRTSPSSSPSFCLCLQRPLLPHHQSRSASHTPPLVRWLSSKSIADEKIEEITELYATAKDEFEIATEETEKQTVYAEDDRKAAKEELEKVQEAFRAVVNGPDKEVAEEVKRRIGQRIRELENGVKALEEMAMNQD